MGYIFLVVVLVAVAFVSLARPWVGVLAAYLIAILTPQAVWWWDFEGLRPAYWVLLPTFVGFFFAVLNGKVTFKGAQNLRVVCLLAFWVFLSLSYYFGPYVDVKGSYRFSDPDWVFSTFRNIFLLCLLGCVCIDSLKKLEYLCAVFIVSAVYLVYWANSQYFSGTVMGRLAGPVDIYGTGTYSDENSFAMLFVVAGSFLWFAGSAVNNQVIRWGIWLILPFAWHAVFLTASRAGLIGVAATTVLIAIRSKRKILGLMLIPALAGAYIWQAGDLMRERALTISDSSESSSAERLHAWHAAAGMIIAHPIAGVGLASFGPAFSDYSDKKPREAHNTVLQICAESGLIAGFMFVAVVIMSIVGLWKNGNRLRGAGVTEPDHRLFLINEATLVAFVGMMVCSMFASLQMYEILYFLCLMANVVLFVSSPASSGISIPARQPLRPSRHV